MIEVEEIPLTVTCTLSGSVEYDGVGHYEFHGQKGFDRGNAYVEWELESWELDDDLSTIVENYTAAANVATVASEIESKIKDILESTLEEQNSLIQNEFAQRFPIESDGPDGDYDEET